jgi:putative oxidoreductase
LIYVVFGLNAFLGFIPLPPPAGDAGTFLGILFTSGYLIAVKVLEIGGGALLLASIVLNRFAPLAVTILTPISVNIFLFHALLAPEGMPMAIALVAFSAFLVYAYKDNFAGIFAQH